MRKVKKSWIALQLGALLMATLVGAVWARPKGGPAAHDSAHKLDRPKAHHGKFHYTATVPAAHFHPDADGIDWLNAGHYIRVNSGSGVFRAAVPMLPGNRTVESVTMYVMDNNGAADACVYLRRTKTDGTQSEMASTCSTGSSGSIRSFADTTISPDKIWGGHGAYLTIWIQGTSIDVYLIQIKYY